MLRGQHSGLATELFRKDGDVTRGKLSLQHVPARCPRNMAPSVCRPKSALFNTSHWFQSVSSLFIKRLSSCRYSHIYIRTSKIDICNKDILLIFALLEICSCVKFPPSCKLEKCHIQFLVLSF